MIKRRRARPTVGVVMTLFLAVAFVVGLAGPALASDCGGGRFCAFTNSGYGHPKLLDSGAGLGSDVDVQDDQTSSGKNLTGNYWCGMNAVFGPDIMEFAWAPNTNVFYVGNSHNDKIDYFRVRSGC